MSSARKGGDIDSALRKKGFRRDRDGKHIQYFLSSPDGRDLNILTFMSHGMMGKTIGAPLIAQMARQLRLTKAQFLDLIDCPISEEDYRTILREQGLVV